MMTLSFWYGKCSKIVSAQYHVKKPGANSADSDQDALEEDLHSLLRPYFSLVDLRDFFLRFRIGGTGKKALDWSFSELYFFFRAFFF